MASQFPIPYSPSRSLRSSLDPFLDLSREMNRLMDNFFPGAGSLIGVGTRALTESLPCIDVKEDQDEICISAELPGVSAADVDVRVDGDVISICGEKKSIADTALDNYRVMERTYGSFRRTVPLPFTPDPQQISAEYSLGVLTIHVPRQAQIEFSQRIEVKETAEDSGIQRNGNGQADTQQMQASDDQASFQQEQAISPEATDQQEGSHPSDNEADSPDFGRS